VPRRPRILIEGGLYHVYNRFARGECVFEDPEEAAAFVDLLREVKRRDGLTILAWALLSNHYHIALRTSAIPLSRSMKHLQGTYSRGFNRRWRRTGPLWQSRYQASFGVGKRQGIVHRRAREKHWAGKAAPRAARLPDDSV
jgi:REP element-mobilizing transposase RayT